MSPDPKRVEALFAAALDLPSPAERTTYLDQACGSDQPLRQRVEALLDAHEAADHGGRREGSRQVTTASGGPSGVTATTELGGHPHERYPLTGQWHVRVSRRAVA